MLVVFYLLTANVAAKHAALWTCHFVATYVHVELSKVDTFFFEKLGVAPTSWASS